MKCLTRKTNRLLVRPLEDKDYKVWRQAHLTMVTPQNTWDLGPRSPETLTKAEFKKVLRGQLERRKKDVCYDLGVFEKTGALIGGVSIMEMARGLSQTAYLGYRIYNSYWGKGYGQDAVRAMLEIGFTDIRLHRIEAGIEPKNRRSIRLARSLDMRREGLKKRALFLRDSWVDLVMYTLTVEDVGRKFDGKSLMSKRRS